jgi:hypothetical protein
VSGCEAHSRLKRDRARKLLDPRFERIGNPGQKSPALARDHARPGGQGIGCSFHGALDVLGPTSWDLGDRAPVRRVLDLEHLARSAVDPLAADQHVPFAKRRLVSVQSLDSRHAHLHRSGLARALRPHFENDVVFTRVVDHL